MKYVTSLFLVSAVTVCGCDTAKESTPGAENHFQHAMLLNVSAEEYRVNPPDELLIQSSTVKEVDKTRATIRPDGKITLNLLGEVYVAGKTPEELSKLLTEAANKYYNNPEVRVEVSKYDSKHYYVFGTTGAQGKKPYTGRVSIIEALAEAGFTDDSWLEQVFIQRVINSKTLESVTLVVDVKKIYREGDTRQNFLLKENDIVAINKRPLAQWRDTINDIAGPLGQTTGTMSTVAPTGTGTK